MVREEEAVDGIISEGTRFSVLSSLLPGLLVPDETFSLKMPLPHRSYAPWSKFSTNTLPLPLPLTPCP